MSTNGHLKFQGTNRATFVGATSNIMFDTTSTSLGIGVTGTDHPSSNLYITGNAYVTSDIGVGGVLTMGTVNVVARHDLESVTATGNTTPLTVEFSNATTGIVTTGNVEVGKELTVTGNATVSSNLTVTGNATVSSNLTVSGNVEVGTANLFVDTVNSRVGIGTTTPQEKLHVYGSPMIQHDTTYQYVDPGSNPAAPTAWYKLGEWEGSDSTGQGANLKLTLLGGSGYHGPHNNKSGETVIHAKLLNNQDTSVANIGGMFYSIGNPMVHQVKFKQVDTNRNKYEVHAEVVEFTQHNMSIECSMTTSFTRSFTTSSDPGVDGPAVRAAKFTHIINESGYLGIGITTPGATLDVRGSSITSGIYSQRLWLSAIGDNSGSGSPDDNTGSPWYGLGYDTLAWNNQSYRYSELIPILSGYKGVALRSGSGNLVLTQDGKVGIDTLSPQAELDVRTKLIAGDYASGGYYNTNSRIHVRNTSSTQITMENIATMTGGIGVMASGTVVGSQGDVLMRGGSTYTDDFGSTGSYMGVFKHSGPDIVQFFKGRNGVADYFYYNTAGNYGHYSDRRGKTNIKPLNMSESVQYIKNLKPISFNYHNDPIGEHPQAGFIAQDVLAAQTNIAQTHAVVNNHKTYDENDPNCKELGISMHNIIPMITHTLQNILERLETLENKNA